MKENGEKREYFMEKERLRVSLQGVCKIYLVDDCDKNKNCIAFTVRFVWVTFISYETSLYIFVSIGPVFSSTYLF